MRTKSTIKQYRTGFKIHKCAGWSVFIAGSLRFPKRCQPKRSRRLPPNGFLFSKHQRFTGNRLRPPALGEKAPGVFVPCERKFRFNHQLIPRNPVGAASKGVLVKQEMMLPAGSHVKNMIQSHARMPPHRGAQLLLGSQRRTARQPTQTQGHHKRISFHKI